MYGTLRETLPVELQTQMFLQILDSRSHLQPKHDDKNKVNLFKGELFNNGMATLAKLMVIEKVLERAHCNLNLDLI